MEDQCCMPDVCTYAVLMNGSCKVRKRNFSMARGFNEEMLTDGLQADCFAYNMQEL